MDDDTECELIEIRTFSSIEEVRALPGFKDNNGVTRENYDKLSGDYWDDNEEAKCCFQKPNGNLCGEEHKWGFVAKLKDGTLTMVGNCCAKDRFGADARIKFDRSRYINEKRRRQNIALLGELLADKERRLAELDRLKERVAATRTRVRAFADELGDLTGRKLMDMARSGGSSVYVDAITYKEYVDEEGNKKTERRVAPKLLGSLTGLAVLNDFTFQAIYSRMSEVTAAYRKAEGFGEKIRTSELESVTAALSNAGQVTAEVERLEQEEQAFFTGPLWLLCFIVDDKSERYKTGRIVLERAGEAVSRERAKAWLVEQEQELRRSLGADKIGIQ